MRDQRVPITPNRLALNLLALVASVSILACTQTGDTSGSTRGGLKLGHWVEVAHVKAGSTIGPVTLGGAWAFIPNMSDGTVTQVERASGKVAATIRVSDPRVLRDQGCAPDSVHAYHSASWGWRACDTPYALAWDGSMLWAIDNGLKRLVVVDPRLHRVAGGVNLPGTGWDILANESTAWVSGWDDDALYVVDVRSQRVIDAIQGLDQGPSSLVLAAGSLWVICARGVGRVDRFDAATSRLLGRYDIEAWSLSATAFRDAVYVRGTNGGDISRLDPGTMSISWTQLGPGFIGRNGVDQIAASADGVWVGGTSTQRFDLATGRLLETIGLPSMAVAAEGQEVWINRMDGTVSELRRR